MRSDTAKLISSNFRERVRARSLQRRWQSGSRGQMVCARPRFHRYNALVPVADILISTPYGKMHDTGVGVSVRVARVYYVYIIILYRLHVAAVKCLLPICSDEMWRAIACLSLCFKTVVHRYFEGIAYISKLQWPKLKILVWLLRVDWLFKNKTKNSHQKN